MNIELILVTHDLVGQELLRSAYTIIGPQNLLVHNISVTHDDEPQHTQDELIKKITAIPSNHNILIITDLYGATPSNIVSQLPQQERLTIVTGLNLTMLIKVFNYANSLSVTQLAEKITHGAQQSIFVCNAK